MQNIIKNTTMLYNFFGKYLRVKNFHDAKIQKINLDKKNRHFFHIKFIK